MAFEINPAATDGEGLKDVVAKQARKAREALGERPKGDAEAAHDARKRFKRVRGALRLARGALGDAYSEENARWREAARRLEGPRDAAALVEAAEAAREMVGKAVGPDAFDTLIEALRARQAEAEGALGAIIPEVSKEIDKGLKATRALEIGGRDWWCEGLARTYARGREALAVCEKDDGADPARWHELRKRAKYHRFHMRLLRPAWPEETTAREDLADALGDVLGLERDLMRLGEVLRDAPGETPKQAAHDLRAALERRRRTLRAEALGQARRLFAEKPKRFAKRFERYAAAG